ncbi:hypothetical protein [Ectobacillus ponti]|uniref:Holin n=1 Tax=Ectobacillus ponti TaxID=2961894 RepID=A0AA42BQC4_9BACI|nr:hypothetical protein [Ectobacillus ponti]MCP8969732.1 hypothetical protein [Ectobacillus ponti]
MNRWRNYGMYASLAALLLVVLQAFDVKVDVDLFNKIVALVLGVLAAAGIISNPTTQNTWFGDDKKEDEQ